MNDPLQLLRADLRDYTGYRSARSEQVSGDVWLNANESPRANASDPGGRLRRYPEPQPAQLVAAMAELYECDADQVLLTRGSDEGIDLLVRAFCAAGTDAVLVARPSFGMYAACARLQGARLIEVDLLANGTDWRVDFKATAAAAINGGAKLVFLASPGNPLGAPVTPDEALALARALEGRALVVIDEAYLEFASAMSVATCLDAAPNLAVLRTLSKAHALAAARVGCLIADPRVVAALRRVQAPYPVPEPCTLAALQALRPEVQSRTRAAAQATCREREALRLALSDCPGVRAIHASQANFLLVEFADADAAYARLLRAGVVVRDLRAMPRLDATLRISVGTPEQNQRVLAALQSTVAA